MASIGKKFVRALRKLDTPADVDEHELIVLITLSVKKQGPTPRSSPRASG